ncbi:MAG: permease-like cell division protein FtsX [Acidimicrobiia bacterium]
MLQRFGYFAAETWKSFVRNWAMSVAGIVVIAISLTGLGGMYLDYQRVRNSNLKWRGNIGAEIFLRVDVTDNQKADVRAALDKGKAGGGPIKSYRYLTHEDALKEFKRLFRDDPDIANSVTDATVLPESFRLKFKDAKLAAPVAQQYRIMPGVGSVALPADEINRRIDQANKVEIALLVVSALLALVAGILIVNTIRLAIFARRREIEVMKLVGASNWFVRVPFMAEGMVQGFIGGLLACGGVILLRYGWDNWFYQAGYSVSAMNMWTAGIGVLLIGCGLGVGASYLGLWRRLDV